MELTKKEKEILVVTILDGSNLIGEVSIKENFVEVKKPLVIALNMTEKGAAMSFLPYLPFTEDGVKNINRDLVVTINKPIKQVLEQYVKAFSPIIMPPTGITKIG